MDSIIGYMPMPAGFPYADVYKKGRPRHGVPGKPATYDAFFLKHPPMENSRRAKLFAPFDALRGFREAIAAKRVLYEDRRELTEKETESLDREIAVLQELADNRRRFGEKPPSIRITYFQPCQDPESDAFGKKGTCETITGSLQKVDPLQRKIILDTKEIPFQAIYKIEGDRLPFI